MNKICICPEKFRLLLQFANSKARMPARIWDKLADKLVTRIASKRKFGVTKRKTKRHFSPKQLAAQRLFAKRAKAGTLRRRKPLADRRRRRRR